MGEEVFQIPDIVDAIFGHLDSKSAIACRSVCKTWKSITDHIFHYDFFLAAASGTLKTVKNHIASGVCVDAKLKGRTGGTALHYAAISSNSNNVEVGRFLIESGADVNSTNDSGVTPLHFAVKAEGENGKEFVKMLIYANADVNAKGNEPEEHTFDDMDVEKSGTGDGGTPVMWAFYSKKHTMDYVRILLQAGAHLKCQNIKGNTALHLLLVRIIYRSLAETDTKFRWATYQHGESLDQDMKLVKMMLAAGADKNKRNTSFLKPLEYAAYHFDSAYRCNDFHFKMRQLKQLESVQKLMKCFDTTTLTSFDIDYEVEEDSDDF